MSIPPGPNESSTDSVSFLPQVDIQLLKETITRGASRVGISIRAIEELTGFCQSHKHSPEILEELQVALTWFSFALGSQGLKWAPPEAKATEERNLYAFDAHSHVKAVWNSLLRHLSRTRAQGHRVHPFIEQFREDIIWCDWAREQLGTAQSADPLQEAKDSFAKLRSLTTVHIRRIIDTKRDLVRQLDDRGLLVDPSMRNE